MNMENLHKGSFYQNLTRDFKKLKADRAESVTEDAEIAYKRHIEDYCRLLREITRVRENLMLELAPTTAFEATVVPADFDINKFMTEDENLGIKERELLIKLEIMVDRYESLFGPYAEHDQIVKYLPNWKTKYNQSNEEE